MSTYSQKVKRELTTLSELRRNNIIELATLLNVCGRVQWHTAEICHIRFATENAAVSEKIVKLLEKTFNIRPLCMVRRVTRVPKFFLYILPHAGSKRVADAVKVRPADRSGQISSLLLQNEADARAFIRAAFIACGSVNAPDRSYHLEFSFATAEAAKQLAEAFHFFHIDAKIVTRRYNHAVYFKESEGIVHVLNIIGAHQSLFDFENIRLVKEVRNNVNRMVNFETANLNRTVNAAVEQVNNILYIIERTGLDALSPPLREMAEIRLAYRNASLKELGQYLTPPIGKSGVNHRLNKINDFADSLRKREDFNDHQNYSNSD